MPLSTDTALDEDPVFLQQMPKIAQHCLVQHAVLQKVDPGKLSHDVAVIDRVRCPGIRQVEPDLQQIHPQNEFHLNGRSVPLSRGVVRPDDSHSLVPRNDLVHGYPAGRKGALMGPHKTEFYGVLSCPPLFRQETGPSAH